MTNKELYDMFAYKYGIDMSMDDNEVNFYINLESSRQYGTLFIDIDAEHNTLTLQISMDGEEYVNATSYDDWDEIDSDEQEEYEEVAQEIVDKYSKTYPSISTGMSAIDDFLIEINEKDDDPLDDDAEEIIKKLTDMFTK